MADLLLGQRVRVNAKGPEAYEVSQAITLSTVMFRHSNSWGKVVERVTARWAEVQEKEGKPPKAILKEETVYKVEIDTTLKAGGYILGSLKEVVIATRNQLDT